MVNENNNISNELVINLTIDGTEYDEVEVKVTDPNISIRDLIARIIDVFNLPKKHISGYTLTYILGLKRDNDEEPYILESEDEFKRFMFIRL